MFRLGLRLRLLLPLLAAFAVLTALIVWQSLSRRDQTVRTATDDLVDHVRLIAVRQQFIVAKAQALLNDVVLRPELRPGASHEECSRFLADRLRQESEFVQLGMALPDGEVACAAKMPAEGRISYADRGWFRQALAAPAMAVGDVAVGRLVPKPLITFAQAMRDADGRLAGVVYVALDLGWLQGELERAALAEGGRLAVFDGEGTVAARYPDPEAWVGRNIAQLPLFTRIAAGGDSGVLEEAGLDGVRRLVAHTTLLASASGRRYHLWLAVPRAVVEAPAQRQLAVGLGIVLAVLAGLLGLLLWSHHRLLVRPLLTLSRAAARFGAGDLDARTGVAHSDDDIGRLARTLDEAAASIQERDHRLRSMQAEQGRTRIALNTAEERFQVMFESSRDAIMTTAPPHWRFTSCNPATLALFGADSEEQFLRLGPWDVSPEYQADGEASQTKAPRMIGIALRDGVHFFEWTHRRLDGQTFPATVLLTRIRLAGEDLMLATVRDVTQEEAAKQQLRKLSQAVEQSPEMILITNLAGEIEYVNHAFVRGTGYSREEAVGRNPRLHHSGKTPGETYASLWETLARGQTWKGEFINRRKDGSEYVVWATVAPIFQADGRASHYLAIEEDISERKRIADQLHQYQHHLQDLVAERTAELEASNAEREKAAAALRAAYDELEQRVVERTRQVRQLAVDTTLAEERERRAIARDLHDDLGQILHVARIRLDALGKQLADGESAPLVRDLNGLVADASARVRSLTSQLSPPVLETMGLVPALSWLGEEMERAYGLAVEIEDDGRPKPLAPAASAILFRAVRELLINVAKHAGSAFARVAAESDGGALVLSVEDQGDGIGDLAGALAGQQGYGLASVRERIAFLNGSMEVRAVAGEGTRVTLRMPLADLGPAPTESAS